jgi:putative transposase
MAVTPKTSWPWTEGRRYLGLELLARVRAAIAPDTAEEANTDIVPALSA